MEKYIRELSLFSGPVSNINLGLACPREIQTKATYYELLIPNKDTPKTKLIQKVFLIGCKSRTGY